MLGDQLQHCSRIVSRAHGDVRVILKMILQQLAQLIRNNRLVIHHHDTDGILTALAHQVPPPLYLCIFIRMSNPPRLERSTSKPLDC